MGDTEPAIEWSTNADVLAGGKRAGAFERKTYAVKADWPDGKKRVRLLAPGEADRHPALDADPEFVEEIRRRLEALEEETVIEEAGS